jgi:hypothetical protein
MTNLVQRLRLHDPNCALEFEAANRIEQLETALSECRDSINPPAPGAATESAWNEAMQMPLAVPDYVRSAWEEANKPPTGTAPCARFCEHTAFVVQERMDRTTIQQLERENAELRKQLQSEHERQSRVWSVIQSQHREYTPLSMQKEQS